MTEKIEEDKKEEKAILANIYLENRVTIDEYRLVKHIIYSNEAKDKRIAELEADKKKLEEAHRWRKVSEELPQPGEYEGYFEKWGILKVMFNGGVWYNKFEESGDDNPTHWKPINPPKESD